jgi:hypothetical protein
MRGKDSMRNYSRTLRVVLALAVLAGGAVLALRVSAAGDYAVRISDAPVDEGGFRSKSAARVLEELAELSRRYRSFRFEAVDNILDLSYLKTVFTQL